MPRIKELDVIDFARRVERLCEFLLMGISKTGTADHLAIENLKDDAADIQFHRVYLRFNSENKEENNDEEAEDLPDEPIEELDEFIIGLHDHMRGVS